MPQILIRYFHLKIVNSTGRLFFKYSCLGRFLPQYFKKTCKCRKCWMLSWPIISRPVSLLKLDWRDNYILQSLSTFQIHVLDVNYDVSRDRADVRILETHSASIWVRHTSVNAGSGIDHQFGHSKELNIASESEYSINLFIFPPVTKKENAHWTNHAGKNQTRHENKIYISLTLLALHYARLSILKSPSICICHTQIQDV